VQRGIDRRRVALELGAQDARFRSENHTDTGSLARPPIALVGGCSAGAGREQLFVVGMTSQS
jgi:hypothetical protein